MSEINFKEEVKNKKIPILVLDQKWHRLFAIHGKTNEIIKVEKQLNELLAEQGQCNNDLKDLKKVKNKLMSNIVQNMDGSSEIEDEEERNKKLDDDKRLIDDVNDRAQTIEDRLLELPGEIKDVNEKLMLLSMDYFSEKIVQNRLEAQEIDEWIAQVRIDLKKNVIKKQNRDINNREIYEYLHDIFGARVTDMFDDMYDDPMVGNNE